ncbi:hypothetical protein Fcan01_00973 [Folsomia candida]|uniref:Uncharacterized protein n=1 Tax=Folsomia candida TaxID=158441 RepID=A0A226EXW6_FOLCA|nr:hypothetical protein Fcan01_00973 [Folsomia candida]
MTEYGGAFRKWLADVTTQSVLEFGSREFIVVQIVVNGMDDSVGFEDHLVPHYHNRHYSPETLKISEPWYKLGCSTTTICFEELHKIATFVTSLNKYLWVVEDWLTSPQTTLDMKSDTGFRFVSQTYFDRSRPTTKSITTHEIADLTTIGELLGIILLQDILSDLRLKSFISSHHYVLGVKHELDMEQYSNFLQSVYFEIIPVEVRTFSFLSCDGVSRFSSHIDALTVPFDTSVWICILVSYLVIVGLLFFLTSSRDGFFILFGICLEISVEAKYETKNFDGKFRKMYIINFILMVWTLMCGTLVPNYWYKTSFTMDMIVPSEYRSQWNEIKDIIDFNFSMPMETIIDNFYIQRLSDAQLDDKFHSKIRTMLSIRKSYNGDSSRLKMFSKLAKMFLYKESDIREIGKEKITRLKFSNYSQLVQNNFTTCEKLAYIDTTDNTVALLDYLRRNVHDKNYVRRDDEFFKSTLGWTMPPMRNSYVCNRLKILVSSGIYSYWDGWYKWKVRLRHVGNVSDVIKPNLEASLNFSSKLVTGFYVGGTCVIFCLAVFCGEILCRLYTFVEMRLRDGVNLGNFRVQYVPRRY